MTDDTARSGTTDAPQKRTRKAGAFDVRTFIAALIGIYGVVLVLTGMLGTSAEDIDRAGGINVNLWAGGGMVIFALAFQTWAVLRPVRVPPTRDADADDRPGPPAA